MTKKKPENKMSAILKVYYFNFFPFYFSIFTLWITFALHMWLIQIWINALLCDLQAVYMFLFVIDGRWFAILASMHYYVNYLLIKLELWIFVFWPTNIQGLKLDITMWLMKTLYLSIVLILINIWKICYNYRI